MRRKQSCYPKALCKILICPTFVYLDFNNILLIVYIHIWYLRLRDLLAY